MLTEKNLFTFFHTNILDTKICLIYIIKFEKQSSVTKAFDTLSPNFKIYKKQESNWSQKFTISKFCNKNTSLKNPSFTDQESR